VNGRPQARRCRPVQWGDGAATILEPLGVDGVGEGMARAAFGFAAARHAGQYRDIDGVPFIVHPIEVGRLLRGDDQPDHVVAAGLLHDVLEKTATPALELELEFGTRIAQLVAAVSDDPSIKEYEDRKRELRDRVERSGSETLAIYAADKIAKVRELALLSPWRARQRKNQAKLAHYRASLEMLRRAAGHTGLVMCLDAELGRLEPRALARRRHAYDGRPSIAQRTYVR
jgi:HD domain